MNCSSTALSANNRKLHWPKPSGGVEQANAVIWADGCYPLALPEPISFRALQWMHCCYYCGVRGSCCLRHPYGVRPCGL